MAPLERRPRWKDPACALEWLQEGLKEGSPKQGAWRLMTHGAPLECALRMAGSVWWLASLGLCPVSAPTSEAGKEPPSRREGPRPSREPSWWVPRNAIPPRHTQPSMSTDQLTEAGSWPGSHSTAGPDAQSGPFPTARSSPPSPEHLESWSGGRTRGGGLSLCLSPLVLPPP